MEKINFHIGQSNELVAGSVVYDLHNHYDYLGCLLKNDQSFCLFFCPNSKYGVGQVPLVLEFADVDFLEFSPDFGSVPSSDLEEMGYKSPSDRDDKWLLREEQVSPVDHLFFRFTGNSYIRIHSKEVRIREGVTLPK